MDAARVEDRVTRRIEETVAENSNVDVVRSTTRTGVSYVYVDLKEGTTGTGEIFDDIALKLAGITDLPDGAGPIQFIKDFGSTAALTLTVASPMLDEVQVSLRADQVRAAIDRLRAGARGPRATVVYNFPPSISTASVSRPARLYLAQAVRDGVFRDARLLEGAQYIGVDGTTDLDDAKILAHLSRFVQERLRVSEFHPDAWRAAVIRDPAEARAKLLAVAGDKYTYRQMDDFTELMKRTFQTVDQVSKVDRLGVLGEQVTLSFSQERIASYGVQMGKLQDILKSRNTALSGGKVEVEGRTVALNPTGEFLNEREIGDVIVGNSRGGAPLYLRDLVDIDRGYESPPRYLNFYSWIDSSGNWHGAGPSRSRSRCAPARRSASSATRWTPPCRCCATGSARPDHGAHLGPAAPGEGKCRPVHGQPLRGDHPRGRDRPDRVLGVALGAAARDQHPAHAGHDLRDDVPRGDRRAADLDRVAHYRAGPPGRRPGGGRGRHQT